MMMPMSHAARGFEVKSDMQRCSCAIPALEADRKFCSHKALVSSSSWDNVPSAIPVLIMGSNQQENEREDMTIPDYSLSSSSFGNVLPLCVAATRTSGHNNKDMEVEVEMGMNICTYTDSSSASSQGDVPSSIVAAMRTTTSGNVITHSGASSIMPISNEEHEEKVRCEEGATSPSHRCVLIVPISREENEDGVGCTTPKGREHRIPELLVCPPPPRKKLKTLKSHRMLASSIAVNPTVKSHSDQQFSGHSFFNPPPDLHTYPNCIKLLFES